MFYTVLFDFSNNDWKIIRGRKRNKTKTNYIKSAETEQNVEVCF